ncbi:RNI-like protein [Hesseltinella vesiculosa]|uniref:RNI-like protein n=1 Tax=Hesseltinella vesiculosa TaxID=101127 RepID=A0A1X2GB13_9FUNG|nr:RNI-like protein [Hesseltinella vesiculosa]
MIPLAVNTRIQVGEDRATVRYVGAVEGSTGEWLGVEWDNDLRGKHNGTHNNKNYFTCRSQTSGSFLRYNAKKVLTGRSFLQALEIKYLETDTPTPTAKDPLYLSGNKKILVETVGFEKVQDVQSNLHGLKVVGLANMMVDSIDAPQALKEVNLQIEDLDLSKNLINDWHAIADLVQLLPSLCILRLNAIRLTPLPPTLAEQHRSSFCHLQTLVLCDTGISWDQIAALQPFLPQVEDLQLSNNVITHLTPLTLPSLKSLNLEYNHLNDWHQINALTSLTSLETLFLNNNQLTSVDLIPNTFQALQFLRLDHNQLQQWQSIDQLDQLPSLINMRCQDNPVASDMPVEEAMAQVIGRVHGLVTLNGNTISPRDRTDLERFYLKLCTRDGQTHDQLQALHPRYSALCKVHGDPVIPMTGTNDKPSAKLNDRLLTITLAHLPLPSEQALQEHIENLPVPIKTLSKRVLATMTVRSLRNLLQKLFQIPSTRLQMFLIQQGMVIPLDDDLRDLKYYGLVPDDTLYLLEV